MGGLGPAPLRHSVAAVVILRSAVGSAELT